MVAALFLVVACADPSPTQRLGGYVNEVCEPTSRVDGQGVVTTTGRFGLMGVPRGTAADEVLLVWRVGGRNVTLNVRAERLDPSAPMWVEWSPRWVPEATPWGPVGYRLQLKPMGIPGCWRIRPADSPSQDGVVVIVDPSPER